MTGLRDLDFYMHYPVCGFCRTAWDIVYQRQRSLTPPSRWVEWCKVGGCDPEIWDFLDDDTGWPLDWMIDVRTGRPDWDFMPEVPLHDNDAIHRAKDMGPNAPWRKISLRLVKQWQDKEERRRNITADELQWDEDLPDEPVEADEVPSDDDIEWD